MGYRMACAGMEELNSIRSEDEEIVSMCISLSYLHLTFLWILIVQSLIESLLKNLPLNDSLLPVSTHNSSLVNDLLIALFRAFSSVFTLVP
ncbi:MAG: hypothetical protein JRH15_17465 [Deltaproteobacteria bacterium]|nr:hypothetical protein [Deltaproteobacteria bacterium]